MAGFDWNGLKRLTHIGSIGTGKGSVRSVWAYITNDADTVVETSGYFNTAVDEMKVGDMILCSIDLDGTPEGKIYMVTANNGTAVTIALIKATADA